MRRRFSSIPVLVLVLGTCCEPQAVSELDTVSPSTTSITLPPPATDGKTSLEKAIYERRSVRSFADSPLTLAQISQLAWAAQGVTDKASGFRTVPSAGALFPLEAYLVVGQVDGLEPGMYRYIPKDHALRLITKGDQRAALCSGALDQAAIREAPVSFVIAGIYSRTAGKYGLRAERFVHMEAGHVGQNLALQAVALGLGSVCIGGYDDSEVRRALMLPDEEVPLYIIPIGRKK
ncbi:MAG: SagB/ThcOx family dehydrogenase [Fimbriimonadia bacterium]|jgi:SagB-type dehydrogenase family enzyme